MAIPARDYRTLSVWAPAADRVDVVLDDDEHALAAGPDGWWVLPDRQVTPGSRYAFRNDGGEPRPDPRSLAQPDGVHGPSEVHDPTTFRFRHGRPGRDLRGAVLYELHVGTFTAGGTLDAAADRFDHLVDLGVEAVELMPLAPFPGDRGWGYDGVDLYAVHAAYGGPEALLRFVDAAHGRGLGVVLDVVHNHLGPSGNYLRDFGPYFDSADQTPWGDAVNFSGPGSRGVRDWVLGSVRQWLVDFRIDGLRLDAVHEIVDHSAPHLLAEIATETAALEAETGSPLTLIAESDRNDPRTVTPVGAAGGARGMDAQWADDVHHALHAFVTGERQGYYVDFGSAEVLARTLTRVFRHDGSFSTFRGRAWGAPVDPQSPHYDGHAFVAFLQNHDQVGNRATGDRISAAIPAGAQAAGAALYLCSALTPMLFMGEEWAATTPFPFFSALDGDLGPQATAGRAREFAAMGWTDTVPDPQAPATRDSAVLDWTETDRGDHARMLAWYRRLTALRREVADLASPDLAATAAEVVDADTVVLRRDSALVVATRADARDTVVDLGGNHDLLAAWDGELDAGGSRAVLHGAGALVARAR